MPYFISETPLKVGQLFEVSGPEAHHLLLSKRAKVGEVVLIQDTKLNRFNCKLVKAGKKTAELEVLSKTDVPKESAPRITICQALISEQAIDTLLTKATELGAYEIVIFKADHSPNSLQPQKQERWQKISLESAKQSERLLPSKITIMNNLDEVLDYTNKTQNRLFLNPQNSSTSLTKTKPFETAVLIGPEGGWSDKEIQNSINKHLTQISLGSRILKAETASISALAILQATFGNL